MIRRVWYHVSSSLLCSMTHKFGWFANGYHTIMKTLHFYFAGDGFNFLLHYVRIPNWFNMFFLRLPGCICGRCVIVCINLWHDQWVTYLYCLLAFSFLAIVARCIGFNLHRYAASAWAYAFGIHFYVSIFFWNILSTKIGPGWKKIAGIAGIPSELSNLAQMGSVTRSITVATYLILLIYTRT